MSGAQSSLRSVLFISVCSFMHLIVQFVFQLILAKYFGASAEMDAYVAAIVLPTVVTSVLVGSLSYAFVPVFIERRETAGPQAAWTTATTMGLLITVVASVVAAGGFWAARPIVATIYADFDTLQIERTAGLFQVLVWLTLANSLISFLQGLYHSEKRFAVPAIASIFGTTATLVFVIALHPHMGISAVSWGVLVGAAASVALQMPLWLRNFHFTLQFDAGLVRCFHLLLPLMLGAAYYRLDPLVDRWLASGMPTGSLSHLGYAWRLVTAILTISTSGLAIVAFPALVGHSVSGRRDAFRAEIAHAMRFLCVVCVPIVVGLYFFSEAVIRDLFERGEFTRADTRAVALLLALYMGMVLGGSLGEVTSKIFYSLGNTRTPVLIGVTGFTLGIVLKLLLAPRYGVAGIVAATSLYYLLNAGWMALLIGRRIGKSAYAGVVGAFARAALGAAIAAATAYVVLLTFPVPFVSLPAAVVGMATYLGLLLLLRDEFATRLLDFLLAARRQRHPDTRDSD